ncbi:hypothetical protein H2201_008401, partial [Coniosporium apollinis]
HEDSDISDSELKASENKAPVDGSAVANVGGAEDAEQDTSREDESSDTLAGAAGEWRKLKA